MRLRRIFNSRFGNCRTRLCLLLMVAACAATASGQATRRVVVETNDPFPNYPVELVAAEVAGGTNNFVKGEPGLLVAAFDAPDDWLRRFTLKLRNKTDKTILSATLNGSLAVGRGVLYLQEFRGASERRLRLPQAASGRGVRQVRGWHARVRHQPRAHAEAGPASCEE